MGYAIINRKELWQGEDIEKKLNMKDIDVAQLEKIVHKIKCYLIHQMILLHDFMVKKEQKDDVEIAEVKNEGQQKVETKADYLQRQYKPLLANRKFFIINALEKFRDEELLRSEITKIKEYSYEPDEYYAALKKHINNE